MLLILTAEKDLGMSFDKFYRGLFLGVMAAFLLAHPWSTAKGQGAADAGLAESPYVGALARLEPSSRIIRLGAPNLLEGARIEQLLVKEGDLVKKGQVLGTFSTHARHSANYKVAVSNLHLAKANLRKVVSGNTQGDILSQKNSVISLKAKEIAAGEEFERIKSLYERGVVSKSKYDNALAEKDRSVADRKAAEAKLTSVSNVRPEDIEIAEAEVQVAQNEIDVAKANVELSTIIAPVDGTILSVYARGGESVGDEGILDLANLDEMDAVAEVDEDDILKIHVGQRAEIFVPGISHPFKGVVREFDGQIKRNTVLDFDKNRMLDTRIIDVRVGLEKEQIGPLKQLVNKRVRVRILP